MNTRPRAAVAAFGLATLLSFAAAPAFAQATPATPATPPTTTEMREKANQGDTCRQFGQGTKEYADCRKTSAADRRGDRAEARGEKAAKADKSAKADKVKAEKGKKTM
jgi:hypothetical protein